MMDPTQPPGDPLAALLAPAAPAAPPQTPQEMYGENFENLPDDLKGALCNLIERLEKENIQARAEEVRRVQRQREFFKGNQNLYWSGTEKRWKTISATTTTGLETKAESDDDTIGYDYVENIYRAHTLINVAVLSQNPPHCEFAPQDPTNQDDIATSKAALDVQEFIGDNNKIDQRQAQVLWFWFHDGLCASYTYWEANADKYGLKTIDVKASVPAKITPDTLKCACGDETELPDADYTDPNAMAGIPGACSTCQQPLGPSNFVPGVMGMVPKVVGQQSFPNGQERIVYMGALEFQRPFFARDLEECPWVTWEIEVHRSWIKSVYPTAMKDIGSGAEGGGDSAEMTARSARIALAGTAYGRTVGEAWGNLVTLRRTWVRPWAFRMIEDDDVVSRLLELFPDGAYVARAGGAYCESRSEQIEKRWALKHAFEGDGMIRDGVGSDLVDVQRRLNIEENIQTETYERSIPNRFIDDRVVDYDAYIEAGSLAAQDFPATPLPGQSIGDAIYDTQPGQVSPQMIAHEQGLRGEVSQFLTGNAPTVFGGDTGGNDTASGISIEKDSAYGRLALFKRALNEFYAETMLNAIDCFVENRTEDVQIAVYGKGGQLDSKTIHLADLRGNLTTRTEADDAYPVSIVQKRSLVLSLLQSPNPQIQAAVTAPDNFDILKTVLGMQDLKFKGEDARRKQYREISLMQGGQPVPVDVVMDQHDFELAALAEWWSSDDGQSADPQTKELARQHALDHMKAKVQLQQLMVAIESGVPIQDGDPGQAPAQPQQPNQGGAPAPAGGPPQPAPQQVQ